MGTVASLNRQIAQTEQAIEAARTTSPESQPALYFRLNNLIDERDLALKQVRSAELNAAAAMDADRLSERRSLSATPARAAMYAFFAGLGAAVAAGVALWANQGADVFLSQAFAALAACF